MSDAVPSAIPAPEGWIPRLATGPRHRETAWIAGAVLAWDASLLFAHYIRVGVFPYDLVGFALLLAAILPVQLPVFLSSNVFHEPLAVQKPRTLVRFALHFAVASVALVVLAHVFRASLFIPRSLPPIAAAIFLYCFAFFLLVERIEAPEARARAAGPPRGPDLAAIGANGDRPHPAGEVSGLAPLAREADLSLGLDGRTYEATVSLLALNEAETLLAVLESGAFAADLERSLGLTGSGPDEDGESVGGPLSGRLRFEFDPSTSSTGAVISIIVAWGDASGAARIAGAAIERLASWRSLFVQLTWAKNWQRYFESANGDTRQAEERLARLLEGMVYYRDLGPPLVKPAGAIPSAPSRRPPLRIPRT
ncbi:MAG: hypothetical protein ACT4PT_07480 [Methanobacteriota archaeon]